MNDWRGRSTLVLGGAGFCGAHLCEQLLARGAEVVAVDRVLTPESYLSRAGIRERLDLRQFDILDFPALRELFAAQKFDDVFHLAAQPIVSVSISQPLQTAHDNVIGTYNALEALRLEQPDTSFLFASSGAYYGATQTVEPIPETAPALVAANIYGPTKAAADLAVRSYAKTFGLKTATCRWMNTYGPGDTNFSRIVPATIARLQRGQRATIDGTDGSNVLEVLHVRDMIAGYLAIAQQVEKTEVRGQAFNFGSGSPLSLQELVTKIVRAWNAQTGESRDEEPLITGPRVDSTKFLDITQAQRVLSWQPQTDLHEGLCETVGWYRRFL